MCFIFILRILLGLQAGHCWKKSHSLSKSIGLQEKTCTFPSVHRRAAIYECQHSTWSLPDDHFQTRKPIWWCPLTDNFDHYPEWTQCPETASTYAGNQPGHACHFPFIYRKQKYTTCIRNGGELVFNHTEDPVPIDTGQSGYWWCSTTNDFDRDGKWTRCRPQLAQQLPCHFAKRSRWAGGMVRGISHECQAFAGHWVCMTELGQLRECPLVTYGSSLTAPSTEGGNDPGRSCHFPFQATLLLLNKQLSWTGSPRKRNHTTCLPGTPESALSGVVYPPWIGYWCATTDNFDRDHLWTRCVLKPSHLPSSASVATTKPFVPASTSSNLAQLWTQLAWFQQISTEERDRLSSRMHAFSPEFDQSMRLVESKRAQWDVASKTDAPNWWIWLAPFWWATYSANQTPPATTTPNHYLLDSSTESQASKNTSPLTRGFQLPVWVDSWSSAGWLEFGLSMKDRWNHLVSDVHMRWYKTWLIAYITGFASALGIVMILILIVLMCLDETKRKQLIFTFFGSLKGKRSPPGLNSDIAESNYVLYTPLNGTGPAKYPCPILEEYCYLQRGHRAHSADRETNKPCGKFTRPEENCLLTDNTLWCTLNPNTDILMSKSSSPIVMQSGRTRSTDMSSCESVHPKSECFRQPDTICPCWPIRDLSCLRYQQQLHHALEIIVNLIRTNGNQNEIHKSSELRLCLQQLLTNPPPLPPSVTDTSNVLFGTGIQSTQDKNYVYGSIPTDQIIPSAPPPSYEQLTDT